MFHATLRKFLISHRSVEWDDSILEVVVTSSRPTRALTNRVFMSDAPERVNGIDLERRTLIIHIIEAIGFRDNTHFIY